MYVPSLGDIHTRNHQATPLSITFAQYNPRQGH
jgi:hypothetical protein